MFNILQHRIITFLRVITKIELNNLLIGHESPGSTQVTSPMFYYVHDFILIKRSPVQKENEFYSTGHKTLSNGVISINRLILVVSGRYHFKGELKT